ncbi:MAG TPA: hypothetical protein VK745_07090 [Polyangiaceae bacterium]|jgi:hypothetical protein|nr:hypothetical protein [Polyangiaceae bacterium]
MRCTEALSLLGLLGAFAMGCEKHEVHHDDAAADDAGKSKVAVDEPDLANAVESVAASRAGTTGGAADGPPPNGIFGPGGADKAMAKGNPATLTLGSDGAAPRVTLGPTLKPGSKRSGSIEVATQSDPRQGAIPIALAVTLEAQKPKADADAGAASGMPIVVKVTGATINAPGVPAEIAAGVAKLRGSHVDYQVGPDGAGSNFRFEAAKGVDPAFRDAIHSLSDTLSVLALPFPNKPIGTGAYWMVTTRDSVIGLDVVTYRLVKVEKVEGSLVTLSLSTKRYAASPAFDVEGLPPDAPHVMAEFHAGTDGNLTISAGDAFPKGGQLDSVIAAALGAADPTTKQRPGVQLQTRATLAF